MKESLQSSVGAAKDMMKDSLQSSVGEAQDQVLFVVRIEMVESLQSSVGEPKDQALFVAREASSWKGPSVQRQTNSQVVQPTVQNGCSRGHSLREEAPTHCTADPISFNRNSRPNLVQPIAQKTRSRAPSSKTAAPSRQMSSFPEGSPSTALHRPQDVRVRPPVACERSERTVHGT